MSLKTLMKTLSLVGLFLIAPLSNAYAQNPTDPDEAKAFITDLADRTMDVLNDSNLSEEERDEKFRAMLEEGFYLEYIQRLVLGHHYNNATAAQREEYGKLFPKYIIRLYASRLTEFGDEKFTITSAQQSGKRDVIVNSSITRPNGAPPIAASWRVRNVNGEIKIIDLVVAGMSQVINQKKQFSALIPREGFDGLLNTLRSGKDQ